MCVSTEQAVEVLDLKYIAIIVSMLLLLVCVSAMTVQAPSVVEVHDSNSFVIEITNTSNTTKDLEINFFSPADVKILSPKSIPAHSKSSARISLNYSPANYTEVESKLEIYLDSELEEKIVIQKYYSKSTIGPNDQTGEYTGALFGLGAIGGLASLGVLEWALFIVLVIVAAILLITLVARVIKVRK